MAQTIVDVLKRASLAALALVALVAGEIWIKYSVHGALARWTLMGLLAYALVTAVLYLLFTRWTWGTAAAVAVAVTTGVVVLGYITTEAAWPFLKRTADAVVPHVRLGDLLWYALAGMAIGSGGGVAFSRNIIYSAFSLLGTLLGVGAMFVYLSADFLAVTQLLIYVGGVLVLILFAIMLTNQISADPKVTNTSLNLPAGAGLGAALAGVLCFVGIASPWKIKAETTIAPITAKLGDAFLQEYLLLFEVASVVLLAALIGAVVMAKKEVKEEEVAA